MRKKKSQAVNNWLDSLSDTQAKKALSELVERMIETEDLMVHEADEDDDRDYVYWESCGDEVGT